MEAGKSGESQGDQTVSKSEAVEAPPTTNIPETPQIGANLVDEAKLLVEVDPTNVFVKYLPPDVSDATLHELFAPFGQVVSCKVMVDTITGSSLGYGFVRFDKEPDAAEAIKHMSGAKCGSKTLLCKLSNSSNIGNAKPSDNLYLKPLSAEITDERLAQLFEPFGEVKESKVIINSTREGRGIGFVRFVRLEDAIRARSKMNGKVAEEGMSPLVVKFAEPFEQKSIRRAKIVANQAAAAARNLAYFNPLNMSMLAFDPAAAAHAAAMNHLRAMDMDEVNAMNEEINQYHSAVLRHQREFEAQIHQQQQKQSSDQSRTDGSSTDESSDASSDTAKSPAESNKLPSNAVDIAPSVVPPPLLPNFVPAQIGEDGTYYFAPLPYGYPHPYLPQQSMTHPMIPQGSQQHIQGSNNSTAPIQNGQAPAPQPGSPIPMPYYGIPPYMMPMHAPLYMMPEAYSLPTIAHPMPHGMPHSQAQTQARVDRSLVVFQLPPSVNDDVLRALFGPFGTIKHAKVAIDPQSRKSRGFGFLQFESEQSAAQAVAMMDGYPFENRHLTVTFRESMPNAYHHTGRAKPWNGEKHQAGRSKRRYAVKEPME